MSSEVLKRALLIGIDQYRTFGKLDGCVADVKAIAPLLQFNADADRTQNFECKALLSDTNDMVTRREMISAINELLKPGAQVALFYFAGHGLALNNDVCLCSSDGDYTEPGVPLSYLIGKAQDAEIRHVVIILDCCNSGGGGGTALLGTDTAILRKGLALLAASRKDQIAKELNGRGEFSTYFGAALEGGAADVLGSVNLAGVYGYLAQCFGSWEQRPTFKANLEFPFELRRQRPLIARESLRQLPSIFSSPTASLKLSPEYERENKKAKPDKVAIYDLLSEYRKGKLIEFDGEEYLYHAAMKSRPCTLTPYGRHYWNLASKKLL